MSVPSRCRARRVRAAVAALEGRVRAFGRVFCDRVTIALEAHVARLQAGTTTIAHQERPEYLDRLAMLATGMAQVITLIDTSLADK